MKIHKEKKTEAKTEKSLLHYSFIIIIFNNINNKLCCKCKDEKSAWQWELGIRCWDILSWVATVRCSHDFLAHLQNAE